MIGQFLRDARGATSIEYALIGGFVSLALVVAATGIGGKLNTTFQTVVNRLR